MSSDLATTDSSEIAQIRFSDEDWEQLNSLTPLQRAFVLEYPKDLNARAAAERAGYQGGPSAQAVRGFQLMRHPVANPLIRKLTAASFDELGITSEWVAAKMYQLFERITESEEDWSPQVAKGLLDSLAKLRGDLLERVEHDHRIVQVVINDVSVEDLR